MKSFVIRCEEEQLDRYTQAAVKCLISRESWAKMILDRAVDITDDITSDDIKPKSDIRKKKGDINHESDIKVDKGFAMVPTVQRFAPLTDKEKEIVRLVSDIKGEEHTIMAQASSGKTEAVAAIWSLPTKAEIDSKRNEEREKIKKGS